jgi:enterobacterial common antigen flippase
MPLVCWGNRAQNMEANSAIVSSLQGQPMSQPDKKTYGQILKSSVLIGGSSAVNVFFRILRTKAMALILGPSGVGLLGIFDSIAELTRSIAGMGVYASGVRQIAEAVGTGDTRSIARTVTILRRVAFYSGLLGALLLIALSYPVSRLTFGDENHVTAIALLALAVFCGDVSAGQAALVQGMRRIADLARMSMWGAFFGTAFSVPIVYFYGEAGVVPSLVCVAATGVLTSWWYARKIQVEKVAIRMREMISETSQLLKLGFVFMASGLMVLGSAYLVRIIILRNMGVDAVGFYQAAWGFGGLYVGFILSAMGADFYPRLTAVAKDNPECNRLVNEQAEVGILMAGPGLLGTLTFAPFVIELFYSAKFGPAVEILRWICLGMMLRVASWPLGYMMVAKGKGTIFFWSELASNLVYVGFLWFGVVTYGLKGAGIAFFGSYVVYWLGVYLIIRRLSGFRWSAANLRLVAIFSPAIAVVFVSWYFLPRLAAIGLGTLITVMVGVYSLKILCTLVPLERFPRFAQRLLVSLRLAPAKANC